MPVPFNKEDRNKFIQRCVPIVLKDKTAKESKQAVAVCNSMWRKAKGMKDTPPDESKMAEHPVEKNDKVKPENGAVKKKKPIVKAVNGKCPEGYSLKGGLCFIKKNAKMVDEVQEEKHISEFAEWTRAFINDLPDSSFLYIGPDGKKDEGGKTVPRSLRKLPYKDKSGKVDLPHLRNALARLGQPKTDIPSGVRSSLISKARKLLGTQKESKMVKDQILKGDNMSSKKSVSIFSDDEEKKKLRGVIEKLEKAESLESAKLLAVELKSFLPEDLEVKEGNEAKEEKKEGEPKEEVKEGEEPKEEGEKVDEVKEEKTEDVKEETKKEANTETQLADALSLNQKMITKLQESSSQNDMLEKINDKLKQDISVLNETVGIYETEKQGVDDDKKQSKFNDVLNKYCDFMGIPDGEVKQVKEQMSTFSEDMLDNTLRYVEKKKQTMMESEPAVETQPSSDISGKENTVMTNEQYSSMSARDKTDYLFKLMTGNKK